MSRARLVVLVSLLALLLVLAACMDSATPTPRAAPPGLVETVRAGVRTPLGVVTPGSFGPTPTAQTLVLPSLGQPTSVADFTPTP